jgi:hypothetical protein
MLVANNKGVLLKATGRITFVCKDGHLIERAIQVFGNRRGRLSG